MPAFKSLITRGKIYWKWIVLLAAASLVLFSPLNFSFAAPTDQHIRIEASMFQFTPAEIRLNPGDRVTLELVSSDVVHGLSIDGYDVKLTADPGQTATTSFIANRPGAFRFRCSVACGNLHPFMLGKFQVGPNLLFFRAGLLAILGVLGAVWTFPRRQNA